MICDDLKDGLGDDKPGSKQACDKGCMCPVLDNGHGKGRGGDGAKYGWVVSGKCPLHGVETNDEP